MGLFNKNSSRTHMTQRRPIPRSAQAEHQDSDLRYKAKSKLIGAVVLAILGVILLPFIFSNDKPISTVIQEGQAPLVAPSGDNKNGSTGAISISTAPGVASGQNVNEGTVQTTPAESTTANTNTGATGTEEIPQSVANAVGTGIPSTKGNSSTSVPSTSVAQDTSNQLSNTTGNSKTEVEVSPKSVAQQMSDNQVSVTKNTEPTQPNKVAKKPENKVADNKPTDKPKAAPKMGNTVDNVKRTDDGSAALALLEGRKPTAEKTTSASFSKAQSAAKETTANTRLNVQVGAFSSIDEARAQRDRLSSAGVSNAFVQSAVVNGKQTYRLRVGPFTSQESAQAALTRLRGLGHSGFITGN
ncbi:SPOR domain-containing protein [Pelistega sp. MC2]|uniref:SPOR domain-containing protein n=1 Tax=Pelistega sp. MC2 TaxID=1720297 RepID=UPI0008D98299|nr:SPOR domain-containing protein [Pelistega sp. MC2]